VIQYGRRCPIALRQSSDDELHASLTFLTVFMTKTRNKEGSTVTEGDYNSVELIRVNRLITLS